MQGITVTLYKRTAGSADGFGRPTYTVTAVEVENVLVQPMSQQEILDTLELTGRKAVYQLALPKGDSNDWEGCKVGFFGKTFRVVGAPLEGIEDLIPLSWNKKIQVEAIDG